MALRLLRILPAIALCACNGPLFLLPGGELNGKVEPVPSDWSFAGDYGTAQLETRPTDPYSVNIAYTVMDGAIYINAGGTETQWAKHIAADPRVRLRLSRSLYELRALRVAERDEIVAFGKAWTSQSTFRRDPTQYSEVWLYRLVPRASSQGT